MRESEIGGWERFFRTIRTRYMREEEKGRKGRLGRDGEKKEEGEKEILEGGRIQVKEEGE